MLDRERIVAQLGEDRDHDPAHEVAALGIGLGGDDLLEELERLSDVALGPGGYRRLRIGLAVAVLAA